MISPVSLYNLTRLMGQVISSHPGTQNVWVTAELSDVSMRGGHYYMELIEKDDQGKAVAKARAIIWQNTAYQILPKFEAVTGQKFASGIKVMVKASATLHPLYGLSLTLSDINPEFTMGDLLRRRNEILKRLKDEGILEANRSLKWNVPALRIAVVSAVNAAGYGDFMNHIKTAGIRYRFNTRLYPAVMQGDRTVASILESLDEIENDIESWDCVVIIRGGGATSDLAAFESYELAARIACYPIPVIVGIGHERDITVLDYVANMRVKTPTAAADWLIQEAARNKEYLIQLIHALVRAAGDKTGEEKIHLSHLSSALPHIAENTLINAMRRLEKNTLAVESIGSKKIIPARAQLDSMRERMAMAVNNVMQKSKESINNKAALLAVLSPQATLNRGYTITMVNGKALKSACTPLQPGTVVTTVLRDGEILTKA